MNGMRIFAGLLVILLAGMAIDLYGLFRIRDFERTDHEIRHARGYVSLVAIRKHGAVLHLEGEAGSYDFSCNAPGLGSSDSCDYRRTPTASALAEVDWVLAPGGLFHGSLRYPLELRQSGEQLYRISVQQVAAAQSRRVMGDIESLSMASGLVGLLLVIGAIRRRRRRIAP